MFVSSAQYNEHFAADLLDWPQSPELEISDCRGTANNDLRAILNEWQDLAKGTKCRKYLFTISIHPWLQQNGPMTQAQYQDYIQRAEKTLGLTNQPRVILQDKTSPENRRVIWSRINPHDKKNCLPPIYTPKTSRINARIRQRPRPQTTPTSPGPRAHRNTLPTSFPPSTNKKSSTNLSRL